MTVRILHGDMREKVAELAADSVDAIVTDPPYGLKFMGKGWDHGVPGAAFWSALLPVAKPGAHLLAFGGTRTFHRLWCAVEDAGWEIRDSLMWLYGEGFPKSSNQEGQWQGWGTALKPAFEPILLARKPLIGSVAVNLAAHGVGALNIDACRIASGQDHADKCASVVGLSSNRNGVAYGEWAGERENSYNPSGRWPANVLHDGSEDVLAAFPDSTTTGVRTEASKARFQAASPLPGSGKSNRKDTEYTDSGSAARFFWCPKASTRDREEGCEGLPMHEGGVRSETSGQHITRRDGGAPGQVHNNHPTVKPTELMRYLVRLITPKGGLVLDPFMGSGSTGKACQQEGMSFTGIEMEGAYVEIAKRRVSGALGPLFA